MDQPCRCGGRNPYCDFCDGSGFVSPPTIFSAPPHLHAAATAGAKTKRVTRSLFIGEEPVTLVFEDNGGSVLLCLTCKEYFLRERLLIHARQSHVNRKKRSRVRIKIAKASSVRRHLAATHQPSGRSDREGKIAKRRKRKLAKAKKSPKSRKKQRRGSSLQRVKQGGSHDRGWRGRRS